MYRTTKKSESLYHEHADYTYFNVVINNNNSVSQLKEAKITKYNDKPIINDTTNKLMSIERISIPLGSLPIWYSKPLDETSATSRLRYTVGLEYDGNFLSKNLMYFPNTEFNTPFYWYSYTYSEFFYALNETIKEIFNELGYIGSGGILPVGSQPPKFLFDSIAQNVSLVAQKDYYDTRTLPTPIKIWSNGFTQDKLESIELQIFDTLNWTTTNNKLVQYAVYDRFDNVWPVDSNYYQMKGDYNILSRWNVVKGIQIKSNLPIYEEYVENNYDDSLNSSSTQSENILRDIVLNYGEFSSTGRTTVEYATNDRIWIDMTPHRKIQNIYIHVYWVDDQGRSFPHYIRTDETVKLKFCIRNKDI